MNADDLLARYNDPSRPGPCEECGRRPVPSRLVPGGWIDSHSGSCSENSALQVAVYAAYQPGQERLDGTAFPDRGLPRRSTGEPADQGEGV